MQNPDESDHARRLAGDQRVADHLAWKKEFFRARPTPPAIGRLHRRQKDGKGGAPVHETLKRARAIVEEERREEQDRARRGHTDPPTGCPVSSEPVEEAPATKQDQWLQEMSEEQGRRNPFMDLKIRTDSRRTTIMANLHPQTVEEDLRVFADQFGRVTSIRIVRHHKTGKSRRYAFVEFGLPAEAQKAAQLSRKKRLRGHAITIDVERGRTQSGFLPKRLATANAVRSSQSGAHTGGAAGSASAGVSTSETVMPAVPPTGDMDAEDALLASILGGF